MLNSNIRRGAVASRSRSTPARPSDLVYCDQSSPRLDSPLTNFARLCEMMITMRTYTIVVEPEPSGGFRVTVPALPGCFTQGSTLDECRERAAEAIAVHVAGLQSDGEPVPDEVAIPQLLSVTVAA